MAPPVLTILCATALNPSWPPRNLGSGIQGHSMHILLALLGIAAAGAFWWYRLKMMNDAAGEVIDAVGRADPWVAGRRRRLSLLLFG